MSSLQENPIQFANPYRSRTSLEPVLSEAPARLHQWLNQEQIEEFRLLFKNAPAKKFNREEFRLLLFKFNIYLSNYDYDVLFQQISKNRGEHISWDEFISHLIVGFREDDRYNQQETLFEPISTMPDVIKSGHRHPIVCIDRIHTMMPDGTINKSSGGYVTVSREGTVNFWTAELEIQKSGISKNPHFKLSQTWILSIATMADVRIICTSSTERDLRFYDTTATNFHLRIIVKSLPWAVNCTGYSNHKSNDETCKLVMGDYGGNVRVIEFSSELRGPFQNKPGADFIEISWSDLLRNRLPQMKAKEFLNIHNDVVRQVAYYEYLNSVISAAECHTNSLASAKCPAMAAIDLDGKKAISKFYTLKGITTFSMDENNLLIVTGGPDTLVRLWNPLVPQKPIAILSGHHAGIVYVFLQPDEKKIYSIDHHRIIKVWAVKEHALLQTYVGLKQVIPRRSPFVCYYSTENHELIVGTRKLISLKCCPLLSLDLTDGETHSAPISVVLYNTLFKSVVTCGLDSFIIVWDPWTGKRLELIKNAHERVWNGKNMRVPITAACFDPFQHLLVTGARDGTLKVWNFKNGICLRNLSIESLCEVAAVFWIEHRILATGWNRHVTEFADVAGQEFSDGKDWETLHDEDVLCAAIRHPDVMATGSYSGVVILWKLETGHPFRQFYVANPSKLIKVSYGVSGRSSVQTINKQQVEKFPDFEKPSESVGGKSFLRVLDGDENDGLSISSAESKPVGQSFSYIETPRPRQISVIQKPTLLAMKRPLSIQSMLFLETRPASKDHGSLLVAVANGMIQIYSYHNMGGFMDEFNAIHMPGDCIVAMATDVQNRYLFTATSFGYIKVWLMKNFCIPENEHEKISMPKLRLRFPFLIHDRFEGRAKLSARNQTVPMLLNSYKAHLRPISHLQYIDRAHILISGSADNTTRLWSLGGRYLGTLGTPLAWLKFNPSEPVLETDNYRMPPDIAKVASSTTLKVLSGAKVEHVAGLRTVVKEADELQSADGEAEAKCIYGKSLTEPILGKHFKLPVRGRPHLKPTLDKSLPYIPVYSHLEIHQAKPIVRPTTPEALKKTRGLEFHQH